MAANTTVYAGHNAGLGMSPGLWRDCPVADLKEGKNPNQRGYFCHLDFRRFKPSTNINASVAYWDQGCYVFGSNGAAIANLTSVLGAGSTFSSDGDDEGVSLQLVGTPFQISRARKPLWFEVRLRSSTIADTKHGYFAGLAEVLTLSATVPIAAAGTLADQNFVGWHRLEGDGDAADFVYKANGVTQVTVKTDAATLVADTFINLGFKWDPQDKNGPNILSYWVDGVRGSTDYTMASADGTDFPNDVYMAPTFALLNATGSSPGTTSISDIWCAQLF